MSGNPQMGSIYSINSLLESTGKDHVDFQKACARNMTPVLPKQGLLSPFHSNTFEVEIRNTEREKKFVFDSGPFPNVEIYRTLADAESTFKSNGQCLSPAQNHIL